MGFAHPKHDRVLGQAFQPAFGDRRAPSLRETKRRNRATALDPLTNGRRSLSAKHRAQTQPAANLVTRIPEKYNRERGCRENIAQKLFFEETFIPNSSNQIAGRRERIAVTPVRRQSDGRTPFLLLNPRPSTLWLRLVEPYFSTGR